MSVGIKLAHRVMRVRMVPVTRRGRPISLMTTIMLEIAIENAPKCGV